MMPTFWPAQRAPKFLLKDLWIVSSSFYLITKEPTKDDKKPEVRMGLTSDLGWARKGTEVSSGFPLGEVHLDGGTLRFGHDDPLETPILRARSFPKGTKPGQDVPIPTETNRIISVSRHAAAVEATYSRVKFYRLSDGALAGTFNFMNAVNPPGSTSWQFNAEAFRLAGLSGGGPTAYANTIASRTHVYCVSAGGSSPADFGKIIGFQGRGGQDGEQAEVPKWIDIGGEPIKGQAVVNRPAGRIGEDVLIFNQCGILHVENPNPASGYQRQAGYVKTKDANGADTFVEVPRNDLANWQSSPTIRYLWSAYAYEVRIDHVIGQNGAVQVTAMRSLVATAEWEWKLKPLTGNDPQTGQVYVYTREYVYQNGQWQYIYTATTEKVPPQYVPERKIGEGKILCAVMATRENGVVRKELPWNAPNYQEQLPGGASFIPGGLAEINPSFWLAVSRVTTGSSGASRWMYSRDKGQSWTLISANYTNSGNNGIYRGQNAVQKDLELASQEIKDAAIAAQVVLAPKG